MLAIETNGDRSRRTDAIASRAPLAPRRRGAAAVLEIANGPRGRRRRITSAPRTRRKSRREKARRLERAGATIYDKFRAFDPWPGIFTGDAEADRLARADGTDRRERFLSIDEGVVVACGDGALRLMTLQRPGKPKARGRRGASWLARRERRSDDRVASAHSTPSPHRARVVVRLAAPARRDRLRPHARPRRPALALATRLTRSPRSRSAASRSSIRSSSTCSASGSISCCSWTSRRTRRSARRSSRRSAKRARGFVNAVLRRSRRGRRRAADRRDGARRIRNGSSIAGRAPMARSARRNRRGESGAVVSRRAYDGDAARGCGAVGARRRIWKLSGSSAELDRRLLADR